MGKATLWIVLGLMQLSFVAGAKLPESTIASIAICALLTVVVLVGIVQKLRQQFHEQSAMRTGLTSDKVSYGSSLGLSLFLLKSHLEISHFDSTYICVCVCVRVRVCVFCIYIYMSLCIYIFVYIFVRIPTHCCN